MYQYRAGSLVTGLACSLLLLAQSESQASGFQTSYHSVSSFSRGLGGAGVSGDDLADIYYNPGGLALYEPGTWQVSVGLGKIENEFEDEGSTRSFGGPSDGDEEGIEEDIPSLSGQYLPTSFLQQHGFRFGLFLGNAFGNKTEYDDEWIGRYHAIESSLRVFDLSPTLAFPVGDGTSIGLALSIQRSEARLSQALIVPTLPDGKATVEGDDIALGFGFGLIQELDNAVLGFSYRSRVKHRLEGDFEIEGTPASDGKFSASADLDLPETVYLSGKFGFADYPRWNFYWTSRWTRWSRNDALVIEIDDPAVGDSETPQNWNDTWLHGAGISYQYNEKIRFRFGLTVDETPIPNERYRTPRQPEGDRQWISFGFSHTSGSGVLDVGINHQIIDDGEVENTATILDSPITVTDTLNGTYSDGSFTLLGIQYRRNLQ